MAPIDMLALLKCTTSDPPAGADFYECGMQALVHCLSKCIANGGDY